VGTSRGDLSPPETWNEFVSEGVLWLSPVQLYPL